MSPRNIDTQGRARHALGLRVYRNLPVLVCFFHIARPLAMDISEHFCYVDGMARTARTVF